MSYSTIEQNADNIYVNVIFNHNNSNGDAPTVAEYRVTKTIPILNKCDDYYCSVIRFSIPLNEVPLFICPVIPGSGLSQITPMIIGITYFGVDYPVNLIYVADASPTALPPINQNNPTRQIIGQYYFCYTYQIMINMINTALATSFTNTGLPGNAPYFYYEAPTKLLTLVVDNTNFIGSYPTPPIATMFMNTQMLNYIGAIEIQFLGYNQPNGKEFQFILSRSHVNPAPSPPFKTNQSLFQQEYDVTSYWDSLKKIIISTNSIPIHSEFTPGSLSDNYSGVSSTFPIITDFVPSLEFAGQSRSTAYYTPTSQYRLVDLKSSEQLNTIDLKIYWQDRFANIYPLYISVYQQASVKLGFFKKSLYKGDPSLSKIK